MAKTVSPPSRCLHSGVARKSRKYQFMYLCYPKTTRRLEYGENFGITITIQPNLPNALAGMNKDCAGSVYRELKNRIEYTVEKTKGKKRKSDTQPPARKSARMMIRRVLVHTEIVVMELGEFKHFIFAPNMRTQNSLTIQVMNVLKEAFLSAQEDPKCKGVLLSSSGSYFCSGIDLTQLVRCKKKDATNMAVAVRDLMLTLGTFSKPVVAFVNGDAIGLGVALLTYCDIVLACDKATFRIPAPKLGYSPEGGIALTFPQVCPATAKEITREGRCLSANQALKCRLVSELVWPRTVMAQGVPRMHEMLKEDLETMEASKAMVRGPLWENLAVQLEKECQLLPSQWMDANCQEAIKTQHENGWMI